MPRLPMVFSLLVAAHIGAGCSSPREVAPPVASEAPGGTRAGAVRPSATVALPTRITSLVSVNGSTSVAAGLGNGQVAVWTTGDIDDGTLAKGGLRVVDATTRAAAATFDTGGVPPAAPTFTSDGRILVGLVGRDLRAWPVSQQK